MIRVPCRCRYVLELPDDQAGLSVQCPRCGLLVDAPLLSDISRIDPDGTYQIGDPVPPRPADDFRHLSRVYYPDRHLPDGTEIDMRGPVEEEIPLAEDDPDEPAAERPRYDPETGELIQELPVDAPSLPRHEVIPEATRVIDYSVSDAILEGSPHGLGLLAALFQPMNVMVMVIILSLHGALMITSIIAAIIFLFIPFPLLLLIMIAGHYAIVVQETGLWERDDLPRPLRNLSFYDDILGPFLQVAGTLLLCYWPVWLVLYLNNRAAVAGGPLPFEAAGLWLIVLHAAGSALLPAVMITMCTSGTMVNLRPDRILGVIRAIGPRYFALSLLWFVGGAACIMGQIGGTIGMIGQFAPLPILTRSFVSIPTLLLGVYLLHALCWYLGLEYRRCHRNFPWAYQEHVRQRETVQRPKLHPKVQKAQDQAARRANQRRGIR